MIDTKSLFRPNYPGSNVKPELFTGEKKEVPTFFRTPQTGDKVFKMIDGKYHHCTSPAILAAVGGSLGSEKSIPFSDLRGYSQGEMITDKNVQNYEIVKEIVKENVKEPETIPVITDDEGTVVQAKTFPQTTDQTLPRPNMDIVPGLTSIIIPAYFSAYHLFHYTGHCIGSIREHTDKIQTPYEIILVLNGYKDAAIKFSNFEETNCDKVIVNDENKGYGFAMNQGIRASVGEYVCFMNNDVMVFDKWLLEMRVALEELDLVMSTPMYGKPFARAIEAEELLQKAFGEQFSDFRDFSCVLTKRSIMEEVGMFNEKLFAYKEDVDLLNRFDAAGKKYASTKRVNTWHCIGGTSVGMSAEELHYQEGLEEFNKVWNTDKK